MAARRPHWLLALVLVAEIASPLSVGQAQETPAIAVAPAQLTVSLTGGAFDIDITVEGVTTPDGLGGYTLALAYDPDVLRAVSVTDSGLVGSTGNSALCPASTIDNDAGRLAHFCFTLALFEEPGPQVGAPKTLATVRFEPVAAGMTALDISESSISDPQGNALAATTSNGSVAVRPSPGPASEGTPSVGSGLPAAGAGGEVNTAPGLIVPLLLAIGGAVALGGALLLRRRRGAS
jgi:hypothetical protein